MAKIRVLVFALSHLIASLCKISHANHDNLCISQLSFNFLSNDI